MSAQSKLDPYHYAKMTFLSENAHSERSRLFSSESVWATKAYGKVLHHLIVAQTLRGGCAYQQLPSLSQWIGMLAFCYGTLAPPSPEFMRAYTTTMIIITKLVLT